MDIRRIVILFIAIAYSPQAFTAKINLMVGLALPPYIIVANGANPKSIKVSGIEYEIVKYALSLKGYSLKVTPIALRAVPLRFMTAEFDGALTLSKNFKFNRKVYFSDEYITYQNYAITLAKNNYQISTINDLTGYSIAAFQNAKKYLGPEFAKMASQNSLYKEFQDQIVQNKLLYEYRVKVVVGDINIFKYYNKKIAARFDSSQKIKLHPLFKPNHYRIVFKQEKHRDDFNEGLRIIKEKGLIEEVYAKYLKN